MDEFIAEQTLPRNATTLLINETLSEESFSRRMFRTALVFDKFYTPILCLFGTLGNSLSLAVFSTDSKYKNQSASLYLSALAISDTGFLLSLLAVWLEGILDGGGVITSSDFSCSLVMYLGQVTCFLSVYLTVAFTIERYVAVHCPFSKGRIFTRSKAKRCVAVLTITALLICSYAWVIAKVIKYPLPPQLNAQPPTSSSSSSSSSDVQHSSESENSSVVMMLAMMAQDRSHNHDGHQTIWHEFDEDVRSTTTTTGNMQHDLRMNNTLVLNNEEHDHDHDYIIPDLPVDYGHDNYDYRYICSVPEAFYKISEIANYSDTIITLIIPFILITFFNVQIATCVWRLKTQRENIVATPSRNSCCDSNSRRCSSFHSENVNVNEICKMQGRVLYRPPSRSGLSHHQTILIESLQNINGGQRKVVLGRGRKGETSRFSIAQHLQEKQQQRCNRSRSQYNSPEVHVTKTLLLVSSVFLVLNLPSHLIRCALFIQNVTGTKEGHEMLRALQPWANILFNTNFAVNFLLYCVSGKSFRSSLNHLLLKKWWGRENHYHHHHRRGKVIKERLNRSFQSPSMYPSRRCSAATTMTMTTGCAREQSCATSYLRIELGNGNMTVDESIIVENNGNGFVKYTPESETAGEGANALEQISPV